MAWVIAFRFIRAGVGARGSKIRHNRLQSRMQNRSTVFTFDQVRF